MLEIRCCYKKKKSQNGECNVRNFRRFFFGMSFDVPAFKVRMFASDFDFLNWSK